MFVSWFPPLLYLLMEEKLSPPSFSALYLYPTIPYNVPVEVLCVQVWRV